VKVLEHGVASNGRTFIVMEFLDGPGLNSLVIGRSSLLDGNRMTLMRQAAEAVGAVHKAGFIHRDVCPRNFVAAKDATSLKLIDFGLTVPNTPEFTQPGNRTGTPNYMAPEVVRRKRTSPLLDVFAFGVTAFEICTFELPWKRGTTGQFAMSHDSPPADIRRYRPTINEVLARAIMQCLEADPAKRPQSLDEFLRMIRKVEHEDEEKSS
jgi:serine/threonine protein kinase